MELCYMNKTNIGWLRDNREIYLTNIEIKRSADQQPQRLINDPVPPFDGFCVMVLTSALISLTSVSIAF